VDRIEDDILRVAKAEVDGMRAAIADLPGHAHISMPARQFARLAFMLERLTEMADERIGSFGDTRYWVPLDHFRQLKDEADRVQNLLHLNHSQPYLKDSFPFSFGDEEIVPDGRQ
jgi:hypothetical protein